MKAQMKAFTLIELLVVIAIIAIIAAILFPVFATAREKARQTSCSSNEKQLALALIQYAQDYDENFPFYYNAKINESPVGWAGLVYPYVKSVNVFACPDDTTQVPASMNPAKIWGSLNYCPGAQYYVCSYSLNANVGWGSPEPLSKFTAPTVTVLLAEVNGSVADLVQSPEYVDSSSGDGPVSSAGTGEAIYVGGNGQLSQWQADGQAFITWMATHAGYVTGYMGGCGNTIGYGNMVNPTGIHNGGSNFAFADGHVKWMTGNQVSGGWQQSPSWTGQCSPAWSSSGTNMVGPGKTFAATFSTL